GRDSARAGHEGHEDGRSRRPRRSRRRLAMKAVAARLPIGVELDDVAVGIREVDLRPRRLVLVARHVVHAERTEAFERPMITLNTEREVTVSGVDLAGPAQRARPAMADQVELPAARQSIPGTFEVEVGPRDFDEA